MKKFVAWAALTGAAAALAACNNGGGSNTTPTVCGNPPGVSQVALVYPAPGSTRIPDAVGTIVVGSTSPLPAGWGATVVDGLGNTFNGAAFAAPPSPIPSPNQTPTFANPVYSGSSVAGFSDAGATIGVFLNNLGSSCLPSVQIGQFTTQ